MMGSNLIQDFYLPVIYKIQLLNKKKPEDTKKTTKKLCQVEQAVVLHITIPSHITYIVLGILRSSILTQFRTSPQAS